MKGLFEVFYSKSKFFAMNEKLEERLSKTEERQKNLIS